jgi:GNAT superfamily N-acetyltransferase
MDHPEFHIVTVDRSNFEKVLPLITAYQFFYRSAVDQEQNRKHFGQFLDDHEKGVLYVALDAGSSSALGFATIYYPFSSVRAEAVCLMNDLFTLPQARGRGVGRALIRHCREQAKAHGFAELFWMTEERNQTAQKLYDSFGAQRTEWLEYILRL